MLVVAAAVTAVVWLIVHATLIEWSAEALLSIWRVLVHVCGVVRAVVVRVRIVATVATMLLCMWVRVAALSTMLLAARSWVGSVVATLLVVVTIARVHL